MGGAGGGGQCSGGGTEGGSSAPRPPPPDFWGVWRRERLPPPPTAASSSIQGVWGGDLGGTWGGKGGKGVTINDVSGASSSTVVAQNFSCTDTVFAYNSDGLYGGALSIKSSKELEGLIQNTTFESNSAIMGGAIYFAVTNGILNVSNCTFTSNEAWKGSHLFIATLCHLKFLDTDFLFAQGQSSLYFALAGMNPYFCHCRFFRNDAPLLFVGASQPIFEFSWFMNYGEGLKFFDTYFANGTNYTFSESCINFQNISTYILNEYLECEIENLTETGDNAQCELGMVIPSATPTVNASWSLVAAKEAMIAICGFAFVAIVGLLAVVCGGCRKRSSEWDLSDDELINNEQQENNDNL